MSRPGDVFHVLLDELLVLEHDLLTGERGGGRPLGEGCFGCSHSLVHLVCTKLWSLKHNILLVTARGSLRGRQGGPGAWAHPIFGTMKTSALSTNPIEQCLNLAVNIKCLT